MVVSEAVDTDGHWPKDRLRLLREWLLTFSRALPSNKGVIRYYLSGSGVTAMGSTILTHSTTVRRHRSNKH